MRTLSTLALASFLAAPLAAQPADPDKKVSGGGTLPAGWSARADGGAPLDNVKFVTMGTGLHFTTGPAVIVWKETDAVKGPFHTLATFNQTKAPAHPEAYGLIVGGNDLSGAGQTYIYFLVRGDGKYTVRKRTGDAVTNLTTGGDRNGWLDNEAVAKQDATTGKASNKLEIDGKVDPSKVSFKVNGKTVLELPAAGLSLDGRVGLRVNHNLDVHVDGFAVHKL
ncbi:MAG TPA: hypothetical protein VFU23_14775 [Gemmatimonadales bacterium]|nr:hypothetical protein [Gemmatimonadales bacterium]